MILFFMGVPMHSVLAKATQVSARMLHPKSTINAKSPEMRRFKDRSRPNRRQACPAKPGWSSFGLCGILAC